MARGILVFTIILLVLSMGVGQAQSWQKYVAPDKSYSFHYPKGWKVRAQESVIEITNPAAPDEQLLIIALKPGKNPRETADSAIRMLRQSAPDMQASDWVDGQNSTACTVTFTSEGKANKGEVLVVNAGNQAFWFSHTLPKATYYRETCAGMLRRMVASMASGTGSVPPAEPDKAKIDKNASAFLFVLEFGLGTPLDSAGEKAILSELKRSWYQFTPQELAKYDQYPKLVTNIMNASQHDLEAIRQGMEHATREWLDSTDQNDPAVKAVKSQLNASSKILIPGEPPLSELAANSYAEIIAFSELVHKNPKATPGQITSASVAKVKGQLIKAWGGFMLDERADVGTTPGLWMTYRQLFRTGTAAEQKNIRTQIAKFTAQPQQTASTGKPGKPNTGSASSQLAKSAIRHSVFSSVQQATFNSYMWSRGYSGWTPMGKMW